MRTRPVKISLSPELGGNVIRAENHDKAMDEMKRQHHASCSYTQLIGYSNGRPLYTVKLTDHNEVMAEGTIEVEHVT